MLFDLTPEKICKAVECSVINWLYLGSDAQGAGWSVEWREGHGWVLLADSVVIKNDAGQTYHFDDLHDALKAAADRMNGRDALFLEKSIDHRHSLAPMESEASNG